MGSAREQISELPPSLLLIYAQLLEQVSNPLPIARDTKFFRRKMGGKAYWFRRVQLGSTRMELSLGRETDELIAEIEQAKLRMKEAEPEIKSREDLVKMLIAGDANRIDPLAGRILALLEGAGVFVAGGVLVGSHAFNVYGNMLGYKLSLETARTADIDLSLEIGVSSKTTDLKTAIMDSGLGFFEVPAFNRTEPSTSFSVRGKELKVDLLTPLIGSDTSKPVFMKALKSYASPVRFMDYLIKEPVNAIVVAESGILVNVPQPARFAIHKLVLSQRRPVTMHVKSIKDLNQAACLLEILSLDRPSDIQSAFIDVQQGRSRKFEKQMFQGFELACKRGLLSDETIKYFGQTWEKLKDND